MLPIPKVGAMLDSANAIKTDSREPAVAVRGLSHAARMPLLETSFPALKLVSRGKVRDIYATSDPSTLLFVATDRISAYDVVLRNVSVEVVLRGQ